MENKTDNLWKGKDLLIVFLSFVLGTFSISLVFFSVVKKNLYVGALLLDVFLLFVVSRLCRKKGISWIQFGFLRTNRLKSLALGGAIGFLLPTLVIIITRDLFSLLTRIEANHFAYMLIHPVTLSGFTGIFLTPFVEEVCERGIFYRVVRNRHGSVVSIFFVSCVVSLLHMSPSQTLENFVIIFAYNIVMSYLYERSGNLYQCISCHMAINYITAFYRVLGT